MRRIGCAAVIAVGLSGAAMAEQIMFSYNTELGPNDAYSSAGQPLEGWCTLIRQDRANWHRFGKRDADDEGDPFFDSAERRAMIDGACRIGSGQFADPGAQIRSGNRRFYVTVQVYGSGGRVSGITIADGF